MKLAYGFYETLPREEYDAIDADVLNFSRLKYLARSPLAFRYHCDNPTEPTAPMILGNAAHLAILEPSMAIAVWPGPGRRFGKEWDAFCLENSGKTLLNVKERDYVVGMAMAVHANPVAHKYLKHGRRELTMTWTDSTWLRRFKARIDNQHAFDGEDVLVSLKTTSDCRDFAFAAQYAKIGYHAQDAIYQQGFWELTGRLPRMVTIAVESKPPHETAVYSIPNNVLIEGQALVTHWVRRLNECEKANKWPGAVEREQDLVLPKWATTEGNFDFDDLVAIER